MVSLYVAAHQSGLKSLEIRLPSHIRWWIRKKNLTIGFMMTKMTGFHTITVLHSCKGTTVNISGTSWGFESSGERPSTHDSWCALSLNSSADIKIFKGGFWLLLANLSVPQYVDHGKGSVGSPTKTKHHHHYNHLKSIETWAIFMFSQYLVWLVNNSGTKNIFPLFKLLNKCFYWRYFLIGHNHNHLYQMLRIWFYRERCGGWI